MYRLEYLPIASQDMISIVQYISIELRNTDAAEHLANEMVEAAEELMDMPYAYPVFYPIKPLKYEYRKLIVKNYIMFYYIDENKKLVIIARVIYIKSNYHKMLT